MLRELLGILRHLGRVADGLEDRDEVANRDALAQEPLQHAMERAERDLRRNDILEETECVFLSVSSISCTSWRPSRSAALALTVSIRCVAIIVVASTTT